MTMINPEISLRFGHVRRIILPVLENSHKRPRGPVFGTDLFTKTYPVSPGFSPQEIQFLQDLPTMEKARLVKALKTLLPVKQEAKMPADQRAVAWWLTYFKENPLAFKALIWTYSQEALNKENVAQQHADWLAYIKTFSLAKELKARLNRTLPQEPIDSGIPGARSKIMALQSITGTQHPEWHHVVRMMNRLTGCLERRHLIDQLPGGAWRLRQPMADWVLTAWVKEQENSQ